MNRRNFISGILAAAVAPNFLKGAARQWKRTEDLWIPNPDYVDAEYEIRWLSSDMMSQPVHLPDKSVAVFHRTPISFRWDGTTREYVNL